MYYKIIGCFKQGRRDLVSCFKKKDQLLCSEGSVCLGWVRSDGVEWKQVMVEPLGEMVAWREGSALREQRSGLVGCAG